MDNVICKPKVGDSGIYSGSTAWYNRILLLFYDQYLLIRFFKLIKSQTKKIPYFTLTDEVKLNEVLNKKSL